MAQQANMHRDPKQHKKPFTPDEINPYSSTKPKSRARKNSLPITAGTVSILKVFLPKDPKAAQK